MIYNLKSNWMFRGSAYSIETDKEMINGSDLMEEEVQIALVGVSDVGKSSIVGCIDVLCSYEELKI